MSLPSANIESSPVRIEETPRQVFLEAIAQNKVFAVLDACDDIAIQGMVQMEESGAVSLYHGAAVTKFAKFAPYLCKVNEPLFNWIENVLIDRPWGYYLVVEANLELGELRKHLRKFLLVIGPDGKELYFRFYDPRIIATFLQSSSFAEASEFFGQIREFIVPSNQQLLRISMSHSAA